MKTQTNTIDIKIINQNKKQVIEAVYKLLQDKVIHPKGKFESGRRFYSNYQHLIDVREPSFRFPLSQMTACRTKKFVSNLIDDQQTKTISELLNCFQNDKVKTIPANAFDKCILDDYTVSTEELVAPKKLVTPKKTVKQTTKIREENGYRIVTRPDGTQEWYKNGELHREDGPAIIDKYNCYYVINSEILDRKEFVDIICLARMSLKDFFCFADELTTKQWKLLNHISLVSEEKREAFKYFLK